MSPFRLPPTRRSLLLAGLALPAGLGLARAQQAAQPTPSQMPGASDPRMSERADGSPAATAHIEEWFSLTCTHCARFAKEIFPEVKAKLIDPGKLRYVFKDYPLDQVALTAAMVARALPPDRYEPFVMALFQTQARWAFDAGANSTDELAKMASLAGMPRDLFDKTIADVGLRTAILAEQSAGEARYSINATPTFVSGTKTRSGEIGYADLVRLVGL